MAQIGTFVYNLFFYEITENAHTQRYFDKQIKGKLGAIISKAKNTVYIV